MTKRVTPLRTIAIHDPEWEALIALGEKAGRSASDLIREQVNALLRANDMMPKHAGRPIINPAMPIAMVLVPPTKTPAPRAAAKTPAKPTVKAPTKAAPAKTPARRKAS